MDQASERTLLKILAQTEIFHTLMSVVLAIGIGLACFLLDRNHRQLAALEAQMQLRNGQGQQALVLLDEAVRKLERRN